MLNDRFQTAGVMGTGMMGPGIAATLALGGIRSTILSRTGEAASKGLDAARGQVRLLSENGLADSARADRALDLMAATTAFDAIVATNDLGIEAAPENMEVKEKLVA